MKTNDEILATWETEGYYTDWYAVDSYNPLDGIIRRLFVGDEADAVQMMRSYYGQPTEFADQPFYRCSLISTDAAKEYFEGIRDEIAREKVEWISTAEAAEILGISRVRVCQLIGSGLIRAEKIGNRYNVDRASVEERSSNPPKAGRRW